MENDDMDTPPPGVSPHLQAVYAAEREERLSSMDGAVVELESAPDERTRRLALERLLRDAHSLKGAAQVVGDRETAEITHALETSLERIDVTAPKLNHVDLVFGALDTLRALAVLGTAAVDVEAAVAALAAPAGPARRRRRRPAGDDRAAPGPSRRELRESAGAADNVPLVADHRSGVALQSVRVSTARLDALLERSAHLDELLDASERHRKMMRGLANDLATWRRQATTLRTGVNSLLRPSSHWPDGAQEVSRELASLQRNIEASLHATRRAARSATADAHRLKQVAAGLQADLFGLRMVAVKVLFEPFARMVRDLAQETGKQVVFEPLGWETPIDRAMVATLKDPVMHLLRNAVRHGIELPEERQRRGKPAAGRIALVAGQRAGELMIEVRDDGAGIDADRVQRRAVSLGLVEPGAPVDDQLALELIFQPSFSTAAVDTTSGRGVGLNVVRAHVRQLGGRVETESEPGRGTSFRMLLPLTLAAQLVTVLRIGGRRYGLPIAATERIVRIEPSARIAFAGREAIDIGGSPAILVDSRRILGLPPASDSSPPSHTAVIVRAAGGRVALLVDALDEHREIVLRDLGTLVRSAPLYAGAALLPDGALLLVLDPHAVVERALQQADTTAGETSSSSAPGATRILVADDSITTRTLEKNILAAAGFEVLLAVDGLDALRILREQSVHLVLSDIEMPHLDGLGLARRIKEDPRLSDIPVLLVSGVERTGLREAALEAHADAFLSKKGLEQDQLLNVIGGLLQ